MVSNNKKIILLIITCVFGIALICCQLYIFKVCYSNLNLIIIFLSMLGLLLYFVNSIYTVFVVSKLKSTSIKLEEAVLHNKTLQLLHDSTSAFRHDFPNILQSMAGYVNTGDIDGLKKYYSQFATDVCSTNNLSILSPKVINNPAVYNVLANKYYKADVLGIKVNLDIFLDFNTLNMKIYEFTRILGILMDNAIEAASECENKIINITIKKNTYKNIQVLLVENSYKNKNIDTDKIYEKGYSTKNGNTGLGLWEIRRILKKNNNLNLYTNKTDELFIQQLEIF